MDQPTNDPEIVIGHLNRQLAFLTRENTKLAPTAAEANDLKDRAQAAEAENRTLKHELHKAKKAKKTPSADQKEWLDERAQNLKLKGENHRLSKQIEEAFEKEHPELEGEEEEVRRGIREEIQGLGEQVVLAKQQLRSLEDDSNDLLQGAELNTESLARIARAVNTIADANKILQPLLDTVPLAADDPGLPNSLAATVGDFLQLQTLLGNVGLVFRHLQARANVSAGAAEPSATVHHVSPHAEKTYERDSREELISKLITALNQREVALNNENKALYQLALLQAERNQAINDVTLNQVEENDCKHRIAALQKRLDNSQVRSQSYSKEIRRLQGLLDVARMLNSGSKTSKAAKGDEPSTQADLRPLLKQVADALEINAKFRKKVGRLELSLGLIQQQNPKSAEAEQLHAEITDLNSQIAAKDRDILSKTQSWQQRQGDVAVKRVGLSQVEQAVQKILGQDDEYDEQEVIGALKRLERDAKGFRRNNALHFTFSQAVHRLRKFMKRETARSQTPDISDAELKRRQEREGLFQELEEEATKLIESWRTEESGGRKKNKLVGDQHQGGRNNDDLSRDDSEDDDEDEVDQGEVDNDEDEGVQEEVDDQGGEEYQEDDQRKVDDDEDEDDQEAEDEHWVDDVFNLDELRDLYKQLEKSIKQIIDECQEGKAEPQNQRDNAKLDCDNEKTDLRNQIEELCTLAQDAHYPVTPVRTLEILIWIKREPRHYYDRPTP